MFKRLIRKSLCKYGYHSFNSYALVNNNHMCNHCDYWAEDPKRYKSD